MRRCLTILLVFALVIAGLLLFLLPREVVRGEDAGRAPTSEAEGEGPRADLVAAPTPERAASAPESEADPAAVPPLAPEDAPAATPTPETRCRLHGQLLNQADRFVPHYPVLLATPARATPGDLVSANRKTDEVARTRTDAEGRFEFTEVPAGELILAPLPATNRLVVQEDGTQRLESLPVRVAPVAVGIEILPGESERYIELRGTSGNRIRGRVEFADGVPAPRASVEAWLVNGRGTVRERANRDGEFAIGPLGDGEYKLFAEHSQKEPDEDEGSDRQDPRYRENASTWTPVIARGGEEGVRLVVTPGGGFRGRVVDAATGLPAEATVFVMPSPGSTEAAMMVFAMTRGEGRFEADDLAPTLYDLFVFDRAEEGPGRVGTLFSVQAVAGEDRPDVEIPIRPGARVSLRYDGPAPDARAAVHDANGRRLCIIPLRPRNDVEWQVPAGRLEFRITERGGPGRETTIAVEAVSGAEPARVHWAPEG